ncbi:MAG: DUF1330 domain-containing protein [Myxococcales bacterium]
MAAEHVNLYALEIRDPARYQQYREAMEPLLISAGGRFGYDFEVSRVLRSEVDFAIHRVFTICFPSEHASRTFFERPDYLAVRAAYFEGSVGGRVKRACLTRSQP